MTIQLSLSHIGCLLTQYKVVLIQVMSSIIQGSANSSHVTHFPLGTTAVHSLLLIMNSCC